MSVTQAVGNVAILDVAKRIFDRGTDCLGPDEVIAVHGKLHGLKLPVELPPIPWSEEELLAAKQAGSHLVLVAPGLTMKQMTEARNNLGTDVGKLLYEISWYKDEPFFTTATTSEKWHWRLVDNEVIHGSTSKNYLEQTGLIAGQLKEIFAEREMPPAYERAIAEFEAKREDLTKLMNKDWQEAAKQFAALSLNQFCRLTPVQTFYDFVTYEAVNHERLLQGMYHWSSTLSSCGTLVGVGDFDRDGAGLDGWSPRRSRDNLGVVLSRSAEVESGG